MNPLSSIVQSTRFQRFSCVVVSTVCVVASLAAAYFCIKNGLGFEKHGKIIGDLAMQWRGTLLEYGAFTYTTAMVINLAVAFHRVFVTDSPCTARAAMTQLLYSLGSPVLAPYVVFQHLKQHGHEHWELVHRNTYLFEGD